jgi:hypothetical protein
MTPARGTAHWRSDRFEEARAHPSRAANRHYSAVVAAEIHRLALELRASANPNPWGAGGR